MIEIDGELVTILHHSDASLKGLTQMSSQLGSPTFTTTIAIALDLLQEILIMKKEVPTDYTKLRQMLARRNISLEAILSVEDDDDVG